MIVYTQIENSRGLHFFSSETVIVVTSKRVKVLIGAYIMRESVLSKP